MEINLWGSAQRGCFPDMRQPNPRLCSFLCGVLQIEKWDILNWNRTRNASEKLSVFRKQILQHLP